jgi:hypothetical protein
VRVADPARDCTVNDVARAILADRLGLDPDDPRLQVLSELTMTAWSVAAREWVRSGADGGREPLFARLRNAPVPTFR